MSLNVLEQALIDRVRGAFPDGHLRDVSGLPGALNAEMLAQLAPRAPGVHIAFLGAAPLPNLPEEYVASRWALYVLTAHASGQAARRRGDAVAAGAYEILPVLVQAVRTTPFEGFGRATLAGGGIENLWSGVIERRGFALYAVTIEIPMAFVGDTSPLADFETFHADYDAPPFDNLTEHEQWLAEPPDLTDSRPDASDTVTLEP